MTMTSDRAAQVLVEQVRAARSARTPLTISGHGSKSFLCRPAAGAVPTQAQPLDVTPLRGISAYEPSELVVTVRAGTPLAELEAALAEQGQCLPFEPPRLATVAGRAGGTVGGMVAAGLAGPARASVGSVRDCVLGATLLSGRAELLSFGGQVMKNVAGYDVARLLAGSWGTLGVICEVSLKVLPVAVSRATLAFELGQTEALAQLQRWQRQALPLSASVWQAADGGASPARTGRLHLRLAGAEAAVQAAVRQLGGECLPPEQADVLWSTLRDQQHGWFRDAAAVLAEQRVPSLRLWRLSLPPHAPALDLPGETLIEWHGGQRWLLGTAAPEAVLEAARRVGGSARVWRGAPGAGTALSAVQQRLQRQILAAFDPDALFNAGAPGAGLA